MNLKNKFHGILSLALVDLATIIAIYAIARQNLIIAAMYTLVVFGAFGIIIYTFCRKCATRSDCSHVFLGPITQLMPAAKSFKYKTSDYCIVAGMMFLILGIPQFWLSKLSVLALLYWILISIAGIQINRFVCRRCNNKACAMCKKKMLMANHENISA